MRLILLFLLLAAAATVLARCFWQKPAAQAEPQPVSAPSAQVDTLKPTRAIEMRGLTLVAPPEPFPSDPMEPIASVGANWIAVVPYAFTMPGRAAVKYNTHGMQWWGEKPVGVRETIRLAHVRGIKVMLKPQVYVPEGWTGNLDFSTDADWQAWESDYRAYIMLMAGIAQEMQAELFCIGTEFRTSIAKRPQFWNDLIGEVRKTYSGPLTYSANWDDWEQVPFYDQLDYAGMSAYHPLIQAQTPSVDSLRMAWQPIVQRLEAFQQRIQKPILFTEFGYLSVDGCGWRNWELESQVNSLAINQEAQARCYAAFFATFSQHTWWKGCFLWKWFPNMRGHEGYPERDYTPQGKTAEVVLKRWYAE